ncbi:uncharacterized protein N7443_008187 [Penicillium atrosanguineum]|uniref:uncharacterized protein n=1 Tax=Penicillium atrosanguineum TaxID=1132637 RepID=UPI002382319C|nr:uncharacterized protein N7443_008187 [Penicillium atrosanguineum]KAJ5297294.1 hypothetical protein N7443_008187 [Penicillium atrosanguineum]
MDRTDRKGLMPMIDERLGLLVAPNAVRLQPSAQDGYAWSVTKSKESLIQTSLSNGSVGLYRAIREELGRSLEAVSPRILRQDGEEHSTQPDTRRLSDDETENESFTAIIRRLEHENQDLRTQLARAREESEQARRHHQDWEAKACRLANDNGIARVSERRLKSQVSRMQRAVSGAVRLLEDHTPGESSRISLEE